MVSAGLSKNVAVKRIPHMIPQMNEFCLDIQYFRPPILPLNPCIKMKIPTNPTVNNLISGNALMNSV